jgi:hypothetical protein
MPAGFEYHNFYDHGGKRYRKITQRVDEIGIMGPFRENENAEQEKAGCDSAYEKQFEMFRHRNIIKK